MANCHRSTTLLFMAEPLMHLGRRHGYTLNRTFIEQALLASGTPDYQGPGASSSTALVPHLLPAMQARNSMQAFRNGRNAPRPCSRSALGAAAASSCRRSRSVRLSCSAAASATTLTKSAEAVRAWAQSKGAKLDKAELSVDLQTEQPILVASADVPAGETLFTVPDAAWLSTEAAQRSSVGKLAAAAGLDPWLQLALQLLADRFGPGTGSELKPYADSLPSDLGSPLVWTEDEVQELQGTQVMQSLSGYM